MSCIFSEIQTYLRKTKILDRQNSPPNAPVLTVGLMHLFKDLLICSKTRYIHDYLLFSIELVRKDEMKQAPTSVDAVSAIDTFVEDVLSVAAIAVVSISTAAEPIWTATSTETTKTSPATEPCLRSNR